MEKEVESKKYSFLEEVGRLGYEIADCSVEAINPSTVNNVFYSYSHFF